MKKFTDKVVVITGASSGIGKALAYEFVNVGAKVSLAARRIKILDEIKQDIESKGGAVITTQTDITIEDDCKNLINATLKHFGKIDILINNAGISMRSLFLDVEIEVLKKLMDVNFWGAVYCTKYALPHLLKQKGVVVGVSSIAGFHGLPGRTGYSASKFALHGFLETLRIENLKNGLHVMVIAPGFTASDIRKHALNANGQEQNETPRQESNMMRIKRRKRNKILTLEGQIIALFQRILPEQIDALVYRNMSKEANSPFN